MHAMLLLADTKFVREVNGSLCDLSSKDCLRIFKKDLDLIFSISHFPALTYCQNPPSFAVLLTLWPLLVNECAYLVFWNGLWALQSLPENLGIHH